MQAVLPASLQAGLTSCQYSVQQCLVDVFVKLLLKLTTPSPSPIAMPNESPSDSDSAPAQPKPLPFCVDDQYSREVS